MNKVFDKFLSLLNERYSSGVYTSEDSIRYTFFYSLMIMDSYLHTDIILESPHPTIQRAKLDTYIYSRGKRPSLAIEFKYDRSRKDNQTRTENAGKLFKDIFRLARMPNIENEKHYLIYITDNEMAKYFRNTRNRLNNFFDLPIRNHFYVRKSILENRPYSFLKHTSNLFINCALACVSSNKIIDNYLIRIYEVFI